VNDEQIERLEARLDRLEQRLTSIETRFTVPPPVIIRRPEPVPPPPTQRIQWPAEPAPRQPLPATEYRTAAPPMSKEDKVNAEYKIGAQVLPRVGAGVFLLGLLYLVILATSRGLITPPMQWTGELSLCAAFIGVGLWKRNEKEDFGQILIGIGSCGLYLSFGGAEAYKHLITGNTLVVSYITLSIANLGFSWWRSSRSFWIIGILGGLVGALLPLREHNLLMNGILQLCIVAIAALVASRRRWFAFSVVLFVTATAAACAALFPIYGDEWKQITFLYLDALICLSAMAATHHKSELDPGDLLLTLAVFGVGILGLCVRDGLKGALHLVIFSATVAALSLAFTRKPIPSKRLLYGAFAVLLLLSPYGFAKNAVPVYGLLCLGSCYLAWRKPTIQLLFLLWAQLGFAVSVYFVFSGWEKPWPTELALMILVAVCSMAVGLTSYLRTAWDRDQKVSAFFLTAVLTTVALLRAGLLVGMQLDPLHRPYLTQIYTAAMIAFAFGFILLKRRTYMIRAWAWTLACYSFWAYFQLMDDKAPSSPAELCILLTFAWLTLILSKANIRDGVSPTAGKSIAMVMLSCLFLRAGFLTGIQLDPLHRPYLTQIYSAGILSYVCGLTLLKRHSYPVRVWGWATAGYSVGAYLLLLSDNKLSIPAELCILVAYAGLTLLLSKANIRDARNSNAFEGLAMVLLSILFLRAGFQFGLLALPAVEPNADLFYTTFIACTVFGVLALFRRRSVETALAWLLAAMAGICYMAFLGVSHNQFSELPMLCLLSAMVFLATQGTLNLENREATMAMAAVLLWGIFSRSLYIILAKSIGLGDAGVVSVAWTLYAVILICVGFAKKAQTLRYMALGLFTITLTKVFIYDLAELDAGLRIGVLMALGMAMIGGGYVYIRARRRLQ